MSANRIPGKLTFKSTARIMTLSTHPPLVAANRPRNTPIVVPILTATNATKPATVETGASINVPLFINEGDKIKVDTEKSSYIERVKG